MTLNCIIIDDEPLAAQLLASYAERTPVINLVGTYNSAVAAIKDIKEKKIDLLFLDIQMPDLSGLEFATLIPKTTKIVFTTAFSQYAVDGYKVNALGYLLKDVEPSVLVKAIHVVNEGNAFVYPKLAERLFGSLSLSDDVETKAREMLDESRGERLTAREMDVLECIAKGFSNQDIGKALGLSEKTVKNHLTSIFHKLKVNDRTQALVYVLKNKIISLD